MKKNILKLVGLLVVSTMIFIACGGGGDDTPSEEEKIEISQKGDIVLNLGESTEIEIVKGNGDYYIDIFGEGISIIKTKIETKFILTATREGEVSLRISDRFSKKLIVKVKIIETRPHMDIWAKDFLIDAKEKDKSGIWIDFNSNGIREKGEDEIEFGVRKKYHSSGRIYGNVSVLHCGGPNLHNIDVSKNPALVELHCNNNFLGSLDVSKNLALVELYCNNNFLESLDVSKNKALEVLRCSENDLRKLDVSKNTSLRILSCSMIFLKKLDVSKNINLEFLNCHYCCRGSDTLPNLDVSKNVALKTLYCNFNGLTSLDVSKNTELESLLCHQNKLTYLDVSKNRKLKELYSYSNDLSCIKVNKEQFDIAKKYPSDWRKGKAMLSTFCEPGKEK